MSRGVPAGILNSRLGGRIDEEVSGVDCDGWIGFAASGWTAADCADAVVNSKRTASNAEKKLFTVTLLPFGSNRAAFVWQGECRRNNLGKKIVQTVLDYLPGIKKEMGFKSPSIASTRDQP